MFLLIVTGSLTLTACASQPGQDGPGPVRTDGTKEISMATMTLDAVSLDLVLENNAAVQDLARRSPIELTVDDYGEKEKVGTLPFAPTGRQDQTPARVDKGEVYLYGSDSLVIFYISVANHWGGYTRLGVLREPDVLDGFVGSGETAVSITFG